MAAATSRTRAGDGLTWPDLLTRLVRGEDLSSDETAWVMGQILSGETSEVRLAAFAVALRTKGETVQELVGMADTMLRFATPITVPVEAVDVVGTGGDRANTVNVSSMAAIVAAAAGARVVKHGNRAASSACGAADVLEQLGVVLDLTPGQQQQVIERVGIGFLFAAHYHPAYRHTAGVRRELGIITPFNFLGPLTNPGRPVASAIGVGDARMAGLIAGVLAERGARGLVFHGGDGLDELTTTTTSTIWVIADGTVSRTELDPTALGIASATVADLVGGDPRHNAEVVRAVSAGEPGPISDIVALNAAATLLAFAGIRHDEDLADQLRPHLDRARDAIAGGAMTAKLEAWVAATQTARIG